MGYNVKLIYSRSNGNPNHLSLNKLYHSKQEGKLETVILNGPVVNLGFSLKRLWSWVQFEINNFRYFAQLKKWKPDVVMVSSLSILTFLFGIFVKKRLKIPLIIEVRDLYPLTLVEVGGFSTRNPLVFILKQIEKRGYKNADLIISSLENTEEYFQKVAGKKINYLWLPMGFGNSIYESIPSQQVQQICNDIKELKGNGKFIIGYAGTIGSSNALEELMQITQDKTIQKNNIHFVFIGDGPLKEFYQKTYQGNSCAFFPVVEKKFVPAILKHCDILVNTWLDKPIYRFGISPNKWIEYMYAERPILLALSSNSKIFDEANCGWQIPAQSLDSLKEAIIAAKNTPPAHLNKLGLNGKSYLVNELSYETLTERLSVKIKEVVTNFKCV